MSLNRSVFDQINPAQDPNFVTIMGDFISTNSYVAARNKEETVSTIVRAQKEIFFHNILKNEQYSLYNLIEDERLQELTNLLLNYHIPQGVTLVARKKVIADLFEKLKLTLSKYEISDVTQALFDKLNADDFRNSEIKINLKDGEPENNYVFKKLKKDNAWLETIEIEELNPPRKIVTYKEVLAKISSTLITPEITTKCLAILEKNTRKNDKAPVDRDILQIIYFFLNINKVINTAEMKTEDKTHCRNSLTAIEALSHNDKAALLTKIKDLKKDIYIAAYAQAVYNLSILFANYKTFFSTQSDNSAKILERVWSEQMLRHFGDLEKANAMQDFLYNYAYLGGFVGGLFNAHVIRNPLNILKGGVVGTHYFSGDGHSIKVIEDTQVSDILTTQQEQDVNTKINLGIKVRYLNNKKQIEFVSLPLIANTLINVISFNENNQPQIEVSYAQQSSCAEDVFENFWAEAQRLKDKEQFAIIYRDPNDANVIISQTNLDAAFKLTLKNIWQQKANILGEILIPQELRNTFQAEIDELTELCNSYINGGYNIEQSNFVLKTHPWIDKEYNSVKNHQGLSNLFSGHDRFDKILSYFGQRYPQYANAISMRWEKIALLGEKYFVYTMKLLYRLRRSDLVVGIIKPVNDKITAEAVINEALIKDAYVKLQKKALEKQAQDAVKLTTERSHSYASTLQKPVNLSLIGLNNTTIQNCNLIHSDHANTTIEWMDLTNKEIVVNAVSLRDYINSKRAKILIDFLFDASSDKLKDNRFAILNTVYNILLPDLNIEGIIPNNEIIAALLPTLTPGNVNDLINKINATSTLPAKEKALVTAALKKALIDVRNYFTAKTLINKWDVVTREFLQESLFASEEDISLDEQNKYINYILETAHSRNLFSRPVKFIKERFEQRPTASDILELQATANHYIEFTLMDDSRIKVEEGQDITRIEKNGVAVNPNIHAVSSYIISMDNVGVMQTHMLDSYICGSDVIYEIMAQETIEKHHQKCKAFEDFAEYYIAHGLDEARLNAFYTKYYKSIHELNPYTMLNTLFGNETSAQRLDRFFGALGQLDSGYVIERFEQFNHILDNSHELLMVDCFVRALDVLRKAGRTDLALEVVRYTKGPHTLTTLNDADTLKNKVFVPLVQGKKPNGQSFFTAKKIPNFGNSDADQKNVRRLGMNGIAHS